MRNSAQSAVSRTLWASSRARPWPPPQLLRGSPSDCAGRFTSTNKTNSEAIVIESHSGKTYPTAWACKNLKHLLLMTYLDASTSLYESVPKPVWKLADQFCSHNVIRDELLRIRCYAAPVRVWHERRMHLVAATLEFKHVESSVHIVFHHISSSPFVVVWRTPVEWCVQENDPNHSATNATL